MNSRTVEEQRRHGKETMTEILGAPYLARREASTTEFNRTIRQLSETFAYGDLWNRPHLDRKTRSLMVLGMLTALNRPHELRVHLEGALNNGCTAAEIGEALTFTVAYCGFPAAIDSLRLAEEILREKGLL